jgi:sulfur relay (sulfurtransferase) DsrC/TusE family protein
MYSKKTERCKVCKGNISRKLQNFCNECSGGFLYSRPYLPAMVIKDQERDLKREKLFRVNEMPETEEEMMKILFRVSIRSNETQTNLEFMEPFPNWFKPTKFVAGRITPVKKQTTYLVDPSIIEELKMGCNANDEHIDITDPRHSAICEFIREMWHPYQSFNATSLIKKRRKKHFVYYMRSNQRYCHRIQREHQSNHVWFIIDPDIKRIFQRCYDPECEGYMTDRDSLPVNNKLYKLMFPELTKTVEKNRQRVSGSGSGSGASATSSNNKVDGVDADLIASILSDTSLF